MRRPVVVLTPLRDLESPEDMNTGNTKTPVDIANYMYDQQEAQHEMVFCLYKR